MTGEQFLARRGFADSRNYSASELGPLLEEYHAELSNIHARLEPQTVTEGIEQKLQWIYRTYAAAGDEWDCLEAFLDDVRYISSHKSDAEKI